MEKQLFALIFEILNLLLGKIPGFLLLAHQHGLFLTQVLIHLLRIRIGYKGVQLGFHPFVALLLQQSTAEFFGFADNGGFLCVEKITH